MAVGLIGMCEWSDMDSGHASVPEAWHPIPGYHNRNQIPITIRTLMTSHTSVYSSELPKFQGIRRLPVTFEKIFSSGKEIDG